MPLIYNGTEAKKVLYNGTNLLKVIYNGVTVFEGLKPTHDSYFVFTDYTTYYGIKANKDNVQYYVTNVVLPSTHNNLPVTYISNFSSISRIETFIMSDSITKMANSCFKGCDNMTDITLSTNLTNISDSAFESCLKLLNINIPNTVTTIGVRAFNACEDLTSIIVPDSVISIGREAFESCTRLKEVILSKNLTKISDYTFIASGLEKITIPESVTSIGIAAFQATKLKEIIIPKNVTEIYEKAFYGIGHLTTVIYEGQAPNIESNQYRDTDVTLYDFSHCTSVPSLYNTNALGHATNFVIKVPAALEAEWKTATNWAYFADNIQGV